MKRIVVCESVSNGHPDKIADQISDAILDAWIAADKDARCGIEVMVKDNIVVLGGEVHSNLSGIDYERIVRKVYRSLEFPAHHNLSPENIKIVNLIGKQSQEIHSGVDKDAENIGAGDQGFVVGFASNETPDPVYMPAGMYMAKIAALHISRQKDLQFGPDVKSQVTMEYDEDGEGRMTKLLISTMQQNDIEEDRKKVIECIKELKERDDVFKKYLTDDVEFSVNPCGAWRTGGPVADCGLTGRKIVVDQYGGYAPVGGGAFSGKDMSKVDRSGAYMARYIAKNIVVAGLADTAKVELGYAISCPKPTSINIELTKKGLENEIDKLCLKNLEEEIASFVLEKLDCLNVSKMMERFNYQVPRYWKVTQEGAFGDFGSEIRPWEKTDFAELLKQEFDK